MGWPVKQSNRKKNRVTQVLDFHSSDVLGVPIFMMVCSGAQARRGNGGGRSEARAAPTAGLFSFLYVKKIKILKIYVCFQKFQKYIPVALWGRQG